MLIESSAPPLFHIFQGFPHFPLSSQSCAVFSVFPSFIVHHLPTSPCASLTCTHQINERRKKEKAREARESGKKRPKRFSYLHLCSGIAKPTSIFCTSGLPNTLVSRTLFQPEQLKSWIMLKKLKSGNILSLALSSFRRKRGTPTDLIDANRIERKAARIDEVNERKKTINRIIFRFRARLSSGAFKTLAHELGT